MSYIGFGIQNTNSARRPRQVFKPVFEQIANGEHPTRSNSKGISKTWKEFQSVTEREEFQEKIIRNNIYLLFAIGILTTLLISALA